MGTHLIDCPICRLPVDRLLYRHHFETETELLRRIREAHPSWVETDGICSRCVDDFRVSIYHQSFIREADTYYFPVRTRDDYVVIPTPVRLDADPRYTGKGITMAFVDSGFHTHADLTVPSNRIRAHIDCNDPVHELPLQDHGLLPEDTALRQQALHGMMTSVVAAGNGASSFGLYTAIASQAAVVLLKVMDRTGHISPQAVRYALAWIRDHHEAFQIRIVNLSFGIDIQDAYLELELSALLEELIACGITIVAAAGNEAGKPLLWPGKHGSVMTVGGVSDDNTLGNSLQLYHSSYGEGVGKCLKPELLAPAIWLAAPLLPGHDGGEKQIHQYYVHVDGTSFAAPIVASVIAQLLEINPSLTSTDIRDLLISTARRLPGQEAVRQGYGVIRARDAVQRLLQRQMHVKLSTMRVPGPTRFRLQHACARSVVVAGTFNGWNRYQWPLKATEAGWWETDIILDVPGTYRYKFLIDDTYWVEDVLNPQLEPDGFNGFNNLLEIT